MEGRHFIPYIYYLIISNFPIFNFYPGFLQNKQNVLEHVLSIPNVIIVPLILLIVSEYGQKNRNHLFQIEYQIEGI